MKELNSMQKNNISPEKIRVILFVFSVVCFVVGYTFHSEVIYNNAFSQMITLVGSISIVFSLTYKTNEKDLKIHRLILNKTKREPRKVFFLSSIISTIFALGFTSLAILEIITKEVYNRSDYIISILFLLSITVSYTLWSKWKKLKKQ